MEPRPITTCCLIGAGNVATHIAQALTPHIDIQYIYSRNRVNAETLAAEIPGCKASDCLSELRMGCDLYIISVPDDCIPTIIEESPVKSGLWVHTSGSVPQSVFEGKREDYGVFYPLQTFSKEKIVDMFRVPMLIEANNEANSLRLEALAKLFSGDVKHVDSEGRRKLHVAAVFACNFVNYMWTQADSLLRETGLDILTLKPLLEETLNKVSSLPPRDAQTGPARRRDKSTIEKHLTMLAPEQADIYRFLTEKIIAEYSND